VLVALHADVLAMVDGEQGLLPFHFAANWGASLDVIFYLLQHCPSALHHTGSTTVTTVLAQDDSSSTHAVETSNQHNDGSSSDKGKDHETCGPVKKKAKSTWVHDKKINFQKFKVRQPYHGTTAGPTMRTYYC
jgi:hypothetical protein